MSKDTPNMYVYDILHYFQKSSQFPHSFPHTQLMSISIMSHQPFRRFNILNGKAKKKAFSCLHNTQRTSTLLFNLWILFGKGPCGWDSWDGWDGWDSLDLKKITVRSSMWVTYLFFVLFPNFSLFIRSFFVIAKLFPIMDRSNLFQSTNI